LEAPGYLSGLASAGVTQLVECNLAKVDVASSSLVTRSISDGATGRSAKPQSRWRLATYGAGIGPAPLRKARIRHCLPLSQWRIYGRQCFQQFGRTLEALALIFIEEPSNEADQGLRHSLKFFERLGSVQMLMLNSRGESRKNEPNHLPTKSGRETLGNGKAVAVQG
jgi:hypothetical protein